MPIKNFYKFVLISVLSLFIFSCDSTVETLSEVSRASTQDSMLVMIYVAGANSLCDEGIYDINCMEYGLFQASEFLKMRLKVVVLYDTYSKTNTLDWSGTRLYELKPDTNNPEQTNYNLTSTIISEASSSLGTWRTSKDQEEDMGNIDTLKNFVTWATERYTTCSKHALILWDHGGGVWSDYKSYSQSRSVCTDDESGDTSESINNMLYIGEISNLLETLYSSENKLEFLGFDACFMGMYEVVYQFRNCVQYMAVSPASEYGGWNYEKIFSTDSSIVDGKNFAINAVKGYKEKYNGYYPDTLTAIDVSKVSELKLAIDDLAKNLNVESNKTSIESARDSACILHEKDSYLTLNIKNYPYYELGSLLSNFADPDKFSTNIVQSAIMAQGILADMNLYTWLCTTFGGKYAEGIPYGLSIFFTKDENFQYQGFYTNEKAGTDGVLGYGCIEAANTTNDGTVNTWYELMCDLYGSNL